MKDLKNEEQLSWNPGGFLIVWDQLVLHHFLPVTEKIIVLPQSFTLDETGAYEIPFSMLLTPGSDPATCCLSRIQIHQSRCCFSNLQLSSSGEPVSTAESGFCSWPTVVEPDLVSCCCSSSPLRLDMLFILRSFSSNHSC